MNKKKKFGQFFTTNSLYITSGLLDIFPDDATVIDPFAGNWDLLNLVKNKKNAYDIDPKNDATVKQDTLLNPPDYTDKWVFTNPPYLARNKNENKTIYDKYLTDDLYKASIKSIIGCSGGIIIIPINFFSSKDSDIRIDFLSKYKIKHINVFEEQVFKDTSYTVCSFSFVKKDNIEQDLDITFYPSKKCMNIKIEKNNGFVIGRDFYNIVGAGHKTGLSVSRLLVGQKSNSDLFLRAVDTGTEQGRIRLERCKNLYYGKNTDRVFATIVLPKRISSKDQDIIVDKFNNILEKYRNDYNSLFLTNFRNATKSYARKRMDFESAYGLIKYIYNKYINKTKSI